jgi:large subunit ribosomal protein L6
VKVEGGEVSVKGPKGELSFVLPESVTATIEGQEVVVSRSHDAKTARAMHGMARSLIANMVEGVDKGYTKQLEIQGVGYRAQMQGQQLVLSVGYSHPIEFNIPDGVTVEVKDNTKLSVTGYDKQMVGQVSAQIRAFAPAEPYKGKGIKYSDEQVRRKVGKTVA